ncbi:hypothetical protein RRF57_010346 [Xylaria bambusicola]|uniref:Uncharacterized protein n=1 Tax=Xylaria bambusicola TaxID=326684 RepID=A0AAN7US52_9PEZI
MSQRYPMRELEANKATRKQTSISAIPTLEQVVSRIRCISCPAAQSYSYLYANNYVESRVALIYQGIHTAFAHRPRSHHSLLCFEKESSNPTKAPVSGQQLTRCIAKKLSDFKGNISVDGPLIRLSKPERIPGLSGHSVGKAGRAKEAEESEESAQSIPSRVCAPRRPWCNQPHRATTAGTSPSKSIYFRPPLHTPNRVAT